MLVVNSKRPAGRDLTKAQGGMNKIKIEDKTAQFTSTFTYAVVVIFSARKPKSSVHRVSFTSLSKGEMHICWRKQLSLHVTYTNYISPSESRLFLSYLSYLAPLRLSESLYKAIHLKLYSAYRFISMHIKLIFMWKVLCEDSLWNRHKVTRKYVGLLAKASSGFH